MRFLAGESLSDKMYGILIKIGKLSCKGIEKVWQGWLLAKAFSRRRRVRVCACVAVLSIASLTVTIMTHIPRSQWPSYQRRQNYSVGVVKESAIGKDATVSVRQAFLHEEPSLNMVSGSEVPAVRTVKKGEVFKVLSEREDWYLLQLSLTGDSAWVKSHCMTVEGQGPKPPAGVKKPESITGGELGQNLVEICRGGQCSAVACAAAVIKDGEVAYTYEFGVINKYRQNKVTVDTKFRIGTLSAFTTMMGVMTLEQSAKLSLEDELESYMHYPVRNPRFPGVPINMRHLLTNTTGLKDTELVAKGSNEGAPLRTLLGRKNFFFSIEPDNGWSLSSSGFGVAGAAVEKVADVAFSDYMDVALFAPLGMNATYDASTFSEEDQMMVADCYMAGKGTPERSRELLVKEKKINDLGENFYTANANCFISAKDLGTLVAILASDGGYGGQEVILPTAIKKIETIHYRAEGLNQCLALRYGENMYDGRSLFYLCGGMYGVRAMVAYDKENRCGVAVITNGAISSEDEFGNYTACSAIIEEIFVSGLI